MIPKLQPMSQSTPQVAPRPPHRFGREMAKNLSKTQAEDEEPETQRAF